VGNYNPIAYAYEADMHCPVCAKDRFGRCEEHNQIACCVTDDEGNEPGAIFSWDENLCGLYCGDCHEEIEEHPETGGEECSECGEVIGDPPDDEDE
jgi:hypothetical protein